MVFPAVFDLTSLNGQNGFTMNGMNAGDNLGWPVSGIGDVNSDGIADFIVGAWLASPNGLLNAGQSYVIFGDKDGFNASFNIGSLDGKNGFTINGINAGDKTGTLVGSAGDINADGIADIVIGAYNATANGNISAGKTYVIFGDRAGFDSIFNLSSLDGKNGFIINGINTDDTSGFSASCVGDINADGIDDMSIGAVNAIANGQIQAGQSYVIYGNKNGFSSPFNLTSLNGENGFTINGINAGDQSGYPVSAAGDVNSDGINDMSIGFYYGSPHGMQSVGQSYVIYGNKNGFSSSFNLSSLDGRNGFAINGINAGDYAGGDIRSTGDVNADGITDVIIGAWKASPNGLQNAGQSFVIFGDKGGFDGSFDLSSLNGSNGFTINGISARGVLGISVSGAGDVNSDGIADIIVGAFYVDSDRGQCYVIFGDKAGFNESFNLTSLDGKNGFAINGINAGDNACGYVHSAGDVNADGVADIVIGAWHASPNGDHQAGQAYVIFGQKSPSVNFELIGEAIESFEDIV